MLLVITYISSHCLRTNKMSWRQHSVHGVKNRSHILISLKQILSHDEFYLKYGSEIVTKGDTTVRLCLPHLQPWLKCTNYDEFFFTPIAGTQTPGVLVFFPVDSLSIYHSSSVERKRQRCWNKHKPDRANWMLAVCCLKD